MNLLEQPSIADYAHKLWDRIRDISRNVWRTHPRAVLIVGGVLVLGLIGMIGSNDERPSDRQPVPAAATAPATTTKPPITATTTKPPTKVDVTDKWYAAYGCSNVACLIDGSEGYDGFHPAMIREVWDERGTIIAVWDGQPKPGDNVERACTTVQNMITGDPKSTQRVEIWNGNRSDLLASTTITGERCKVR